MTDFFYTQTAAQLQSNHDKVSATTGALIDENNFQDFNISKYTENRFKGNQNPVVKGKDGHPLPSATPTTYPAGDEIAAGIIALTTVVNLTYVNGVYSADSGVMRRLYTKDPAGLITKTSQYGCLKLTDGSQLQALVDDISTGARIAETGSDIAVDGDFAVTDFRFIGLSDERGVMTDVNDIDSISANGGYDNILDWGNYTSGTFSYPNGRSESDYRSIYLITDYGLGASFSTGLAIITEQQIAKHPSSWGAQVLSQAGETAAISATTSTSFSVSVTANDVVRQVIGFLK